MTSLPSPARDWASSVTLHGIVAAIFLMLLRPLSLPSPATDLSWEVDLFTAPPPSAAAATQRPPAPEPPSPAARPAMPSQAPAAAPMPVPPPAEADKPSVPTAPTAAAPTPVVPAAEAPAAGHAAHDSPTETVAQPLAPPAIGEQHPRSWYANLVAKMQELKQYPLVARRRGQEGVVVIEARIRADGGADTRIAQSSGHDLLDRAALRLIGDALAALRGQGQAPAGRLEIPVAYRLDE